MTARLGRLRTLALPALLLASACGGDDPPPAGDPTVVRFDVMPMTVIRGETVDLSWRTENALEVTIVATPGGVLVDKTTDQDGTAESLAINERTVFALTARNGDKTATAMKTVEVMDAPSAVRIVQFGANPMAIAIGASSTLSWEVVNATSLAIDEVGGANILQTDSMFTGSISVSPTVETSYVLTAQGNEGPRTQTVTITVAGAPSIDSFTATPATIGLGEMSSLAWSVTNATMITVVTSGGAEVYAGGDATGSVSVTPDMTETYTLTARNPISGMVTRDVTVTVNRGAEIVSFTASPDTIDYGDSSTLQWVVERATGIEISTGGVVLHTVPDLMGSFVVTATVTTSYRLVAFNTDGDSESVATVTVNPAAPRVTTFEAQPNPAQLGATSSLRWTTIGAVTVQVQDAGGAVIYDGADAIGSVDVTVTATIALYTLTASNPHGRTTSTVMLLGQDPPAINTFTVTPLAFTGASASVTIDWDTTGTTTRLERDGVADAAFPGTPAGTYTVTVNGSTTFTLHADNAVGTAAASLRVEQLVVETEPNDTPATAQPLPGAGVRGQISPANDVDVYSVVVPADGNVRVEVSDGLGGCALDTTVTLIAPDGTTALGGDEDDGFNLCSAIDPARDAFAANLPAGLYFVQVEAVGGATGAYTVVVVASPPICGNGILERGPGERCDDANTTAGDGCDATCNLEAAGNVPDVGRVETFGGTLATVGRSYWYSITMTSPGFIRAEAFVPTVGRCDDAGGAASTDTALTLYNANILALGSDDDDGVADCARIDPLYDTFAAVPAGTYWIELSEDGDDATLGAYTLVIETIAAGCQNGIVEAAETCDDGNAANGDGCSELCAFEGTPESEPNDTSATADVIPPLGGVVSGEITAGDFDVWAVTVPEGYHLDAYVTVNGFTSCPEDPEARLLLLGTNGSTILATNTTGGPGGNCGRIWPYTDADSRAMTAGTYFLRVNETGDDAAISSYVLHVRVLAPGCGNEILEGAETCDDGNTSDADGCSATCTFEPIQTINLPSTAPVIVSGGIDPSFSRHAVRLDVASESLLYAEVFSPVDGACIATATRLQLYAADGTTVLLSDTTDGIGSCSQIHPARDAAARLAAGAYFLVLEESGNDRPIFQYELVVDGRAPDTCGNRVQEATSAETCDDGNTTSGDGCDATCQIESDGVLAGPPAAMTFSGAITTIGDQLWYRLDLSAPSIIIAETYAPVVGSCTGSDTILRLYDSAVVELTNNDDINGAMNRCSRIDGLVTAAARVPAGTYFLRVEDFLNNDTIPALQLDVQIRPLDACGNGLQESTNNESCDDGNTSGGDGCSAGCVLEPTFTWAATAGASQTFAGLLDPATDVEVVRIDVTGTLYLRAETFAPASAVCATADTRLTLMSSAGVVLASDDLDGVGSCSLIERARDTGARLTAGTYFLIIEEDGRNAVVGAYEIALSATPGDVCGDGIRETAAGESCDDGNTTGGDGCSALCALEIAATYTLPGATATFSGNLPAATAVQAIQLDVTVESFVRVEVNAPSWPDCLGGIDPVLRLFDSAVVELASDDADGRNSCSMINPDTDTFARLMPGTYYLSIEEDGRNAIVGAYQVRIQSAQAGICGNGYVETGEQCDDGDLTDGDGCSATCTFDVTTPEVEPNNASGTANNVLLSGVGVTTVSGNVTPAGDLDFFQLVVPPGPTLVLRARTYSAAGNASSTCNDAIDTRLQLYAANGTTLLEDNDDINGSANRCSILDGTRPDTDPNARLVPGTYYLRVSHFSGSSPAPAGPYFLQIQLQE